MAAIDYVEPGPMTRLDGIDPRAIVQLAHDPVEICRPVHALVIQPPDAEALGLGRARFATNQIRPATRLLGELLALNPQPVNTPRPPGERIVGTCRHFATIACALLRHGGVPARVRCGFATYFQPGQGLDHWITEYRDDAGQWVRIDTEILDGTVLAHPEKL